MSYWQEQITNLTSFSLEDAKNTAAYVGMAIPPAVVIGRGVTNHFGRRQTNAEGIGGVDLELIDEVQKQNHGAVWAQVKRYGGSLLLATGLSALIGNGLDPTVETKSVKSGAGLVVLDQSNSMVYTSDMENGLERLDAAAYSVGVLSELAPEDYRLGVIAFAGDHQTTVPLTTDRQALVSLESQTVDSNGGDMLSALDVADDILAAESDEIPTNMFVISDGTIEDTEKVKAKIVEITEKGTKVTVVVPGTAEATYKDTQFSDPVESGATSAAFDGIEDVAVVEGINPQVFGEHMAQSVKETTEATTRHRSHLFNYIGGLLIAVGLHFNLKRIGRREV
jgi:hypothetical protein